jgi:hypothetical protein
MTTESEPSPPPKRPSTWIIVAAALATAALILGLVTIFSQEGDRLLNGTAAAPAEDRGDARAAGPAAGPDPAVDEPAPPETLPADQGTVTATCTVGPGAPNAQTGRTEYEERCALDDADVEPFATPQPIALSVVADASTDGPARSFVSADGSGFVTAGYVLTTDDLTGDDEQWFVGGAPGVGPFAGTSIHFTGRAGADGATVYDWYVDDGLPPTTPTSLETGSAGTGSAETGSAGTGSAETGSAETGSAETGEVRFVCERTVDATERAGTTDPAAEPIRQSCTYEGDDPRFVPTADADQAVVTASGGGAGRFGSTRYFAATYESGAVRTGLVDADGVLRFTGLAEGTGELSGLLVHEIGWGETNADGSVSGIIRMTALAPPG